MIVACPHCNIKMDVTNIAPGTTLICPSCSGQSLRPPDPPPPPIEPTVAGVTPPLASTSQPATPALRPSPQQVRPAPTGKPTSGLAIASLAVSLISLGFCAGILSPVGLILGIVAMQKIKQAPEEIWGRGLAIAGIALGVFGILLLAVLIVVAVFTV